MQREKIIELIQPFVFEAKVAKIKKTYKAFLRRLENVEGYSEEERKILRREFGRYLKRPYGKGWCFEFETCRWFRVRKLTPRECFRLMDVDEEKIDRLLATAPDKKGEQKQIISNSQLYKCAGNSIVVKPMEETFENIFYPAEKQIEEGEQLSLF